MALKVYLDNQDFSNLLYKTDPETVDIKNYLLKKSANNEISVGYSYFNIAEFLTNYEEKYKQDRMNRISFIKQLCQRNAYIFVTKLSPHTEVLSKSGDWCPEIDVIKYLMKGVKDHINRDFAGLISGKSRKSSIENTFKQMIRNNAIIFNSNLSGMTGYPMPESFKKTNIFMRYICGLVPETVMRKQVKEYLNDLDLFRELWFDYGKKENYLHNSLTEMANGYIQLIPKFEKVILDIRHHRNILKSLKKDSNLKQINQHIKPAIIETEKKFKALEDFDLTYLRSFPDLHQKLASIPNKNISSVIAYVKGAVELGRKIKPGDYGDILHAIYLPYVDLWRCDFATYDILKAGNVPEQEKIIARLSDLPSAIDRRLQQ